METAPARVTLVVSGDAEALGEAVAAHERAAAAPGAGPKPRVAVFAGDPDDDGAAAAIAEMTAELFPGAEVTRSPGG